MVHYKYIITDFSKGYFMDNTSIIKTLKLITVALVLLCLIGLTILSFMPKDTDGQMKNCRLPWSQAIY